MSGFTDLDGYGYKIGTFCRFYLKFRWTARAAWREFWREYRLTV